MATEHSPGRRDVCACARGTVCPEGLCQLVVSTAAVLRKLLQLLT